jgi:hypothetical protein
VQQKAPMMTSLLLKKQVRGGLGGLFPKIITANIYHHPIYFL